MDIDQFVESRSPGMRWLLAIFIWGLFVFGTLMLKDNIGSSAGALLILPTIFLSWYLGLWPGVILAFGGFFVYSLVDSLMGMENFQQTMQSGGLAGILISIFVSGVIGKIGGIARAQRKDMVARDQAAEKGRAQTRFLSLLNDIVQSSLEANDMSGILKILVSQTGKLFNSDDCIITFWDDRNKITIPMASYGPSSEIYNSVVVKPGELTLTSSVLEIGHALVIENSKKSPYVDPEVMAPFPDISCSLVLPLISGERKIGAIILSFHTQRQFSADEIIWGELAARQVSLALTKVLLLEESNKRVQELTGLYQISRTLHLPDISRDLFGQLTETMAQLVDSQACLICLHDLETRQIIAQVSAYGLDDDLVGSMHYSSDEGARAWDFSEKGIFCTNSIADIPSKFIDFARELHLESVMAAPMWSTDQDLFGMVFALNKPAGFDQDDVRLLGVFAAQASFVIQNIQLFDSERRRNEELSVLNAISTAATDAHNEDELIEFVTRMIGEKLYPDNFGILMLDDNSEHLKLHSSYRLGEQEFPISIPVGKGITGNVVRKGKTMRVNDVNQVADYLCGDERICSELCVPLKIEDRVIGVANAESAKLNAFTQRDEDLLSIIAGQLASAIERLRTAEAQYKQTTELARSNAMIKVLAQVGSRASMSVNPDGVMQTLGVELSKLGLMCVIALPEPDGRNMHIAYTSMPARVIRVIEKAACRKLEEFIFPRERFWLNSQESMEPILLNDPVDVVCNILFDFPRQSIQKLLSPIGVTPDVPICHLPLIVDNEFKGVFWLWGEGLRTSDMPTMSIFGSQVAIAMQNAHLMAKVQKMALMDDLTGIFNRGYFFEVAEREFSQARRYGLPLSVAILDIDHFKKFNDSYGHIVGDQVLRNVAQVLQSNLRENDTLGRYGGEEFSILMPITDIKSAYQVAMRLKNRVAESTVATDAGPVGVKISVGVTQMAEDMLTLLSLINRADQAMYIAKSTGGNSVAMK
jgi:diguanylate cyclase (GGDEF)-like protein